MRALVYEPPGTVGWQEVPEPALAEDGVLIRPLAVSRCDLDPVMVAFDMFPGPYVVGHEVMGEVVTVGREVTGHAAGDRVLVPFQVSCGTCRPCLAGRFNSCLTYRAKAGAAFGFGPAGGGHGGGMADLLAVPHADHLLVRAPSQVDDVRLAVATDNLLDGYRAVGPQLAAEPDADVLVIGDQAAAVGLYAVAAAVALGAPTRFVGGNAAVLAAAAGLGAGVTEHHGGWPRRFERSRIVVENTGSADGLAAALRSTDDEGSCLSVAIHFGDVIIPLLESYTRGLTYRTGRADARKHLPAVTALIASGRLDPARIPTRTLRWEDAADAWLAPAIKTVFVR